MRLWSLHPRLLDSRGLVAAWREALLAQAVLRGRTRGYRAHPQLIRFRQSPTPLAAIAAFLAGLKAEADARGYHFDAALIGRHRKASPMMVTRGQLELEWRHLRAKLRIRDPAWLRGIGSNPTLEPHPVFVAVAGRRERWERARAAPATRR